MHSPTLHAISPAHGDGLTEVFQQKQVLNVTAPELVEKWYGSLIVLLLAQDTHVPYTNMFCIVLGS